MGFPPSSDLAIPAAPSPAGVEQMCVQGASTFLRHHARSAGTLEQSHSSRRQRKPTGTNLQNNKPPASDIESHHLLKGENKFRPILILHFWHPAPIATPTPIPRHIPSLSTPNPETSSSSSTPASTASTSHPTLHSKRVPEVVIVQSA